MFLYDLSPLLHHLPHLPLTACHNHSWSSLSSVSSMQMQSKNQLHHPHSCATVRFSWVISNRINNADYADMLDLYDLRQLAAVWLVHTLFANVDPILLTSDCSVFLGNNQVVVELGLEIIFNNLPPIKSFYSGCHPIGADVYYFQHSLYCGLVAMPLNWLKSLIHNW